MNLEKALSHYFGYKKFRKGQKEVISDILKGKNVMAMLPTGTGKSVCYQLPAMLLSGLTIVVSPLLSLMEDQVHQLKSEGIKEVAALNSFLPYDERILLLKNLHKYKLLYVSPEILQADYVLHALRSHHICLFVIDEAHCISQWGHEFRTDYLKLGSVHKELNYPPCLAITATASREVQDDITKQLGVATFEKHIFSVDRPNIALTVYHLDTVEEKVETLVELTKSLQGPGMIYFSSRAATEKITAYLQSQGLEKVAFYHGGMLNEDRILIQQQFIENQLHIICCTNAFGMGINKKNVRYVIHYHYPSQMESYIQEIGRAGRDGKPSVAILLYSKEDRALPTHLIEAELPNQHQLRQTLLEISYWEGYYLTQANEAKLLNNLPLTETVWRFLKYQLEQLNVIDEQCVKLAGKEERVLEHLETLIDIRLNEKKKKLFEMEAWIETDKCRREMYVQYFHEKLVSRPENCCDICSFPLKKYEAIKENEQQPANWEERLQMIFYPNGMEGSR